MILLNYHARNNTSIFLKDNFYIIQKHGKNLYITNQAQKADFYFYILTRKEIINK